MEKVSLFKVGADPEFGFLDRPGGSIVEASGVMTRARPAFGLDGCDAIAEMRPDPSINPAQVVQNLYNDFTRGYLENPEIRDLYWKAGSCTDEYATGGHIHLGLHNAHSIIRRNRQRYYRDLVPFLDTYVGQVGRLLEKPEEGYERVMGNEYGGLGDYRSNAHGMEYRVLGSWLTSPRVAEGCLALCQAAAFEHLSLVANKKVPPMVGVAAKAEWDNDNGMLEVNFNAAIKSHRKKFPELAKRIRRFKLYKRHEVPIEFILKLVEHKKTWFPGEGVDIKTAWGIESAYLAKHKTPSKTLPSVRFEDIWQRSRG